MICYEIGFPGQYRVPYLALETLTKMYMGEISVLITFLCIVILCSVNSLFLSSFASHQVIRTL